MESRKDERKKSLFASKYAYKILFLFVGHTVISRHSRVYEYFTLLFSGRWYFLVSTMVSFCRGSVAWDKLIAYSATHTQEADSS